MKRPSTSKFKRLLGILLPVALITSIVTFMPLNVAEAATKPTKINLTFYYGSGDQDQWFGLMAQLNGKISAYDGQSQLEFYEVGNPTPIQSTGGNSTAAYFSAQKQASGHKKYYAQLGTLKSNTIDVAPIGDSWGLKLTASADNFATDSATPTLSWTSKQDISNNNLGIYIFDETTDTLLDSSHASATSGSTDINRFYDGGKHLYVAYVADWSSTVNHIADLSNIQVSSSSTQIERKDWVITQKISSTSPDIITITTNQPLQDSHSSTPHYAVYLVNFTTGDVVAQNTTMNTSWNYNLTAPEDVSNNTYVAVIAGYQQNAPTSINTNQTLTSQFTDFQAASKYSILTGGGWNISLSTTTDSYRTDEPVPTFTWITDPDLASNTNYGVYLVDSNNQVVAKTHTANTSGNDTSTGTLIPTKDKHSNITYTAYVGTWSATATQKSDIQNIQAISESVTLDREPWQIDAQWYNPGTPNSGAVVSACANQPIDDPAQGASGYKVYAIDTTTNTIVTSDFSAVYYCYTGTIPLAAWNNAHTYQIVIADASTTATSVGDLTNVVARSTSLNGADAAWRATLFGTTWYATPQLSWSAPGISNQNYYSMYLVRVSTGEIVKKSTGALQDYDNLNVPWPDQPITYKNYVAKDSSTATNLNDLTEIVASSPTFTVTEPIWYFYSFNFDGNTKNLTWQLNHTISDFSNLQVYVVNNANGNIIGTGDDAGTQGLLSTLPAPTSNQSESYKLYIANKSTTATNVSDLTNIRTASGTITTAPVSNLSVSLSTDKTTFGTEDITPKLIWTANTSAAIENGNTIYIVDTSSHQIVGTSTDSLTDGQDFNSGYVFAPRFLYDDSHSYKAYIAATNSSATTYADLQNVVSSSGTVTINRKAWTVDLQESAQSSNYYKQVTVTTNQNVVDSGSPDPKYAVYLVDETLNAVVAENHTMGRTTAFTLQGQQANQDHTYRAYVAAYQPSLPTPSTLQHTQAQSSQLTVAGIQWTLELQAPTSVSTDQRATFNISSTVAAPGNFDYAYYLVDETTNTIVGKNYFASGNSTQITDVDTYNNHPQDTYRAYIAPRIHWFAQNPDEIQDYLVKSAPVTVNLDTNWQVAISSDDLSYRFGGNQGAFNVELSKPIGSYYAMYAINPFTGVAERIDVQNYRENLHASYSAPQAWAKDSTTNWQVVIAKRTDAKTTIGMLQDIQARSNVLVFHSNPIQIDFYMHAEGPRWPNIGNEPYSDLYYGFDSTQYIPNGYGGYNWGAYIVDEDNNKAFPLRYCNLAERSYITNPYQYVGPNDVVTFCYAAGGTLYPADTDERNAMNMSHHFALYIADAPWQPNAQGQLQQVWHTNKGEFASVFAKSAPITPTYTDSGGATPDDTTGGSNLSTSDCSACSGDPINTGTGEFYENVTDAAINNPVPLAFTRSYSSTKANELGSLGYGWTSNFDMKLKGSGSPMTGAPTGIAGNPTVTVVQENNSTITFLRQNDGTYKTNSRTHATLTYNDNSGNFVLTRDKTYRFKFNSDGKLIQLKGLNDNLALDVAYDSNGRLDTVTAHDNTLTNPGAGNKKLTFAWNSDGLISSVTDGTNGNVTGYTYDTNKRLTHVDVPKSDHDIVYDYYDTGANKDRVKSITNTQFGVTTNHYNADGRVDWQEDPNGNTTTYSYALSDNKVAVNTITYENGDIDKHYYDAMGQLTQLTKAYGTTDEASVQYQYSIAGQKIWVQDSEGNFTTLSYNADGTVATSTDANNHMTEFEYNSHQQVTKIINPRRQEHKFEYDANGALQKETSFGGKITTYDANDNGTTHIKNDPNGNSTTYGYDSQTGQLTTIKDALNNVTTFDSNASGDPEHVYDDDQNETTYHYDSYHRLDKVTYPNASYVSQGYYPSGAVEWTKDRLGHTTTYHYYDDGSIKTVSNDIDTLTYTYDERNRVKTVTSANNGTTTYGYDKRGNQTSVAQPGNRVTHATYYKNDLLKTTTDAENHTTTYYYDKVGNQKQVTDAKGSNSYAAYDELNRMVSAKNGISQVVGYEYDADGKLTKLKGPNGRGTEYAYDDNGNLLDYKAPDGHHEAYTYDKVNNLRGYSPNHAYDATDPITAYEYRYTYNNLNQLSGSTINGVPTTYTYNEMGQKLSEKLATGTSDASETDYTYAPITGQLIDATKDNSTVHYEYDDNGNLTYRGPPTGNPATRDNGVQYGYNDKNQLADITYPDATVVHYGYNTTTKNLQTVTLGNSTTPLATYTYNKNDAPLTTAYGNGVTNTVAYDEVGNLATNAYTKGTTNLYSENISINSAGLLTTQATTVGTDIAKTRTYGYDASNQLAGITETDSTDFGYAFDARGNLLINGVQTNNYGTGSLNPTQLTSSVTGTTKTDYTYATGGNLGRASDATVNTSTSAVLGSNAYAWHKDGTLAGVTKTDSTGLVSTTAYTYDTSGLLTQSVTSANGGSSVNNLVWDTSGGLPTILADSTNDYIYGLDDVPLAQVNHTTHAIDYLHANYLGSVVLTTDDTGAQASSYKYDAFGKTTAETGDSGHNITPFGYAGQYQDQNTGYYYMRARWYDPNVGSFLSVDPIRSATHKAYNYADANPISNVDPRGLDAIDAINGETDAWTMIFSPFSYGTSWLFDHSLKYDPYKYSLSHQIRDLFGVNTCENQDYKNGVLGGEISFTLASLGLGAGGKRFAGDGGVTLPTRPGYTDPVNPGLSTLKYNQLKGDSFRDYVQSQLGYTQKEVTFNAPVNGGKFRRIDAYDPITRTGVETKNYAGELELNNSIQTQIDKDVYLLNNEPAIDKIVWQVNSKTRINQAVKDYFQNLKNQGYNIELRQDF